MFSFESGWRGKKMMNCYYDCLNLNTYDDLNGKQRLVDCLCLWDYFEKDKLKNKRCV